MANGLEYPYRAKPLVMLAGIVFFGACAAFGSYAAITNDSGVISFIGRSYEFSVEVATAIWWGVAIGSLLFVVAAVAGLISGIANPLSVRLTSTELSAPKSGLSRKPTVIPLQALTGIDLQPIHNERIMKVHYRGGTLSIAQSMLPSSEAFEELYSALAVEVERQLRESGVIAWEPPERSF